MLKRIILIILLALIFAGLTSCGGGSGSKNPIVPYMPPSSEEPPAPEGPPVLPYPQVEEPLPDPINDIVYEISTDRNGRAVMPGFSLAEKRSQASLPMKVSVVDSNGFPLRHIVIRRILLPGSQFVLFVWDPSGYYNPRFISSESLSRTSSASDTGRSAMFTELLGKENISTTNIGIGSKSIDISVGLDRVSMLDEGSISSYKSYFTDENLLNNFANFLNANIYGGQIVRFSGVYNRWNLGEAVSTLTSDGALVFAGGYVNTVKQKLSTYQMGTPEFDSDDDPRTNSFVSPRIPTDSTNCFSVYSTFLQVAKGTNADAVQSSFDSLFLEHPLYKVLGDEQNYILINFRPIIGIKPEVITTPNYRVNNVVIILPIDPRKLSIEPSDGSYNFSSTVPKILKMTGDYTEGAKYALTPLSKVDNWWRNTVNTNVDPIFPGDVISQPGQGLLPSATFLVEINRFVSVTHFLPDYLDDPALRLETNLIELQPFGGSVTNLPPIISATAIPSEGRVPLTVQFDASASHDPDLGGAIISYEWAFGNPDVPGGGTATGAKVEHTYTSPGIRTAILTVKDNGIPQNTVMKQFTITITTNQPPVAIISHIDETTGRVPFTVQFDGTQSYDPDGQIVEFRWDFGTGDAPVYLAAPEYTFTTPGVYYVTLRVTDNGPSPQKSAEDQVVINVLPESTNTQPVASFTADPTSGPAPLTVQFDSSGSYDPDGDNLSYHWSFNDVGDPLGGGTSDEPNPVYTYDTVQSTIVTLQVTDDGDPPKSNTYNVGIEVQEVSNENPIAVIKVDKDSGLTPLTVNFDGTESTDPDGQIIGYSWDFGDGLPQFGPTVSHEFTTDGVYNVTLFVTDNASPPGNGNTQMSIVVGNTRPVAVIQTDTTEGNAPLTVQFDASSSYDPDGDNLSYEWDFGDHNLSTDPVTSHVYNTVGEYTVILRVTDDHGTPMNLIGSATVIIKANEPPPNAAPVVVIGTDVYYGSAPLTVQFNSTDGSYDPDGDAIVSYAWDFGGAGNSLEPNPQFTFDTDGEYLVNCALTDDGVPPQIGIGTKTIYVGINVPPVADARADVTEGLAPLTVHFDGSNSFDPDGTITSYLWDFKTLEQSTEASPTYVFANEGTYDVLLSVTDNNLPPGRGFDTITIKVTKPNLPPTAKIQASPTFGQAPLTVNFFSALSSDPDGTITSVLWNFGDPDVPGGGESTNQIAQHIYNTDGNFTVSLTVWDNGTPPLSDEDTIVIEVSP